MRLLLPISILICFSSCFHKDVMSDRADDVMSTLVYKGTEGSMIITKEQIFQATSKKSGGGITTISGHSDYRITSYDLSTGALLSRVNMGDGMESAFIILGTSKGKIWLYSMEPEIGFHSRNPKTLEVIDDEKSLAASAAFKGFSFARPEYSKLNQLYGWSAANGNMMLSDMQGFHYYYDPEKKTLEKTEDAIIDYNWSSDVMGNSAYFTKEEYVSLSGNGRQKLMYRYEDSTGKFSYLDAQILIDANPQNDEMRKVKALTLIDVQEKKLRDSISHYHQLFPKMASEGRSYSDISQDEWKAKNACSDMQREFEDLERDKKSITRENSKYIDHPVLSDAEGNVFVIHATDVTDTSRMLLTKLNLKNKSFSETWTLKLTNFYRDPEKADNKDAFQTVFSDGNPEFRYKWVDVVDGKLIIISQLRMICLDAATGKVLWENPL